MRLPALTALLACCACAATAHAGSIAFVRGDNVWVAAPDGTHQAQVTTGRRFASPSQADDGTIVAIDDGNALYRMTQAGVPRNAPVFTWLGLGGGSGFSGPYLPRVSPDGTKIAFGFYHEQGLDPVTGTSNIVGGISYTWADHATDLHEFGLIRQGWTNPTWAANDLTVSFWPGADVLSGYANVLWHEVGHKSDASSDTDNANAYQWFDDPDASYGSFGAVNRQLTSLAVGEGVGSVTSIRLYSIPTAPPAAAAQDDPPVYRCTIDGGASELASPSWSPDGGDIAYQQGSDTYVVHVGDLAQGCVGLGQPRRVLTDAQGPAWGPADVKIAAGHPTDLAPGSPADGGPPRGGDTPPAVADVTPPTVRVSVVAHQHLATALARGLRIRVGLDEPAALQGNAAAGGRLAAGGASSSAGTTTLSLRFPRAARRRLHGRRSLRLSVTVTARDAAGNIGRARRAVTLRR
ncbi:MAG: hypothetical protein E6G41_17280 [Actinobacteria bacterium]|nr:MAG: hypothetical protein E6G41_17280 [Actinomycetota bacterium]